MKNDESNINIINIEVKSFLTEHFAEKIQFCPSKRANEPLFVFSSWICVNDVAKRLRSKEKKKNVSEKLRKIFLEVDFNLNDNFCDGEDLLGSWDNLPLTDEILTFLGTLFNINPSKLLPKCPKKYPSNYFTQVPNNSDSNDESNSNNRHSLIPHHDESNVLDDDKNISQTFDVPLKIKFLFRMIYYNNHNSKKETPLQIMNSSAIYKKCKSRELLTSFNRLGLFISCKEAKLHRNNLAKLAISRYNDTGIPLPTHFSKSQFTIAAMDNFDHSGLKSLTKTAGTHDTTMTLFQMKPESCCAKPLKSGIN